MREEGLRMVGVKVMLEDSSEIELSCWAVAFLQKGEGDNLLTKWEWSRREHSAVEIALRGAAIEGLLGEYSQDTAIKGALRILESERNILSPESDKG